jgi:hypothetical protein
MAVTNPQAITFCNQKIRPAADKLARAYNFARMVMDEWSALNMGTLIPTGGGEVEDGAAADGRPVINADQVVLLTYRLNELIADYEADTNLKLNTVLQVAVNPEP